MLIRRRGELNLLLRTADGWRARPWQQTTSATGPQEDSPWVSGLLDIGALPDSPVSSTPLANGLLLDGERRLGWSPSLWIDDGQVHLAFDRCQNGQFDVIYRPPNRPEELVAGTDAFEAHASVTVDSQGRVWLAWDQGSRRWGQHPGLHLERSLQLAVRSQGTWHEPPSAWPDELMADESGHPCRTAELPHVVADESGPVWLLYRAMIEWPHSANRRAARRFAWVIRALVLTDDGWIGPVTLPESSGPNHDTLAAVPLRDGGVAVAYATDHRLEHFESVTTWAEPVGRSSSVVQLELRVEGGSPAVGAPRRTELGGSTSTSRPDPDPDPALKPAGYRRFWGDLHRHSDLSRCKMDIDGSVLDQYRQAIEVVGLDFLALTDHVQHLTLGDQAHLDAAVTRFQGRHALSTLYGFEHANEDGHFNLVGLEGGALARLSGLARPNYEPTLDSSRWVAIPHQIADPPALLNWRRRQLDLERLLEIFQSRRGSYEERDAPGRDLGGHEKAPWVVDLLSRGKRYGFIASSDHGAVGRAFAAVLATDDRPASILEALRARRCYAASARIALDVRLGELLMGQAGSVPEKADLDIRVDAGAEIARVDVIRNGRVAQSWSGPPSGDEQLTIRIGRAEGLLSGKLVLEDGRFGEPVSVHAEAQDVIERDPDGRTLRFASQSSPTKEVGWILPLRAGRDARIHLVFAGDERRIDGDSLRAAPVRVRAGRARLEIRLDPPPLGGVRFEQRWVPGDWKPGDWCYVRVLRTDGELAWSSPIWID